MFWEVFEKLMEYSFDDKSSLLEDIDLENEILRMSTVYH